jgi:hypothetical protein
MEPTRHEAEVMLAEAQRAERSVRARSAKEHVPFYLWGAFLALVIPGFDLFDRDVWGWVTICVAVAGFIGTCGYFLTRVWHVRVAERSPWWTWPVLTVWHGVCAVSAVLLDGALPVSYVLAGWVSALPLFVWGARLRKAA